MEAFRNRSCDTTQALTGLLRQRLAALAAVERLALGAAHTLNNAFTAVLGEASFLLDERKQDSAVAEACGTILAEVERCARITRGLLARRHPAQAGAADVDLVRLVRELGALLGETLGSRHPLEVRTPDELLVVPGDAASLELLVLSLVHYGADHAERGSRIALAVEDEPAEDAVALRLFVTAPELPEWIADAFVDPRQAPDPVTRASLEVMAETVGRFGGRRSAARTAPDGWAALIHLPAAR
jgi:signal transduction histidine kinase